MNEESKQEVNKDQKKNSEQTKLGRNESRYVEFGDDFLDLNPDHCMNSENASRKR